MAPGQIEKQCFRNNDGGWIGVVTLDSKNQERAIGVAPGDLVWLSEDEQRLTANAPRQAADNPFVEQERIRINDESGAREPYRVTPLTPVSERRFIPSDARPVPGVVQDAEPAPTPPEEAPPGDEQLESAASPAEAPAPPPRAAAAVAATEGPSSAEAGAEEEHAAAVDPAIGEETGAARPPLERQPEGEYAMHEEVGTPDAPQASSAPPPMPAPFSPGSSEPPAQE